MFALRQLCTAPPRTLRSTAPSLLRVVVTLTAWCAGLATAVTVSSATPQQPAAVRRWATTRGTLPSPLVKVGLVVFGGNSLEMVSKVRVLWLH